MNPFLQAVQSGYSDNDILSHVSRHFPRMKGMVSKALKSGYTAQQIIEFLSSQGSSVNTKGKSQSDILKANSDADASIAQGAAKTGAALAGSALGAYALSRAIGPNLTQAIGSSSGAIMPDEIQMPQANQGLPVNPTTIDISNPQIGYDQKLLSGPDQNGPSMINPPGPKPPGPPPLNLSGPAVWPYKIPKGQASEIFKNLKEDKRILNLLDSQTPEIVSKIMENNFISKGDVKQLEKQTGMSFQDIIKAFAEEAAQAPPQSPQLPQNESIGSNIAAPEPLKQKQDLTQVPQVQNVQTNNTPLQASVQEQPEVDVEVTSEPIPEEEMPESENRTEIKTRALPDGRIAKVLSEKNGIAKIEVDGEIKHRKTEDLIDSDLSEDELADLYEKAFMSIPKSDRSSNLFWGGYDEEKNQFAYLPHAGALYIYDDVPQDLATQIKDLLVNARTTGSSAFGAWTKGDPSRGAAMFNLIEKLKSREKDKAAEKSKISGVKEPVQKEYSGKFQPVHAPFQRQQKILQKRHADTKRELEGKPKRKPRGKK